MPNNDIDKNKDVYFIIGMWEKFNKKSIDNIMEMLVIYNILNIFIFSL